MHSLDWFKDQCHEPTFAVTPSVPALKLDSDEAVEPALTAMVEYFGEDPSRKAVEVFITGERAGYFERKDVYALFTARDRRVGPSSYSPLPGSSTGYGQLVLRCPVEGCTYMLFAFTLEEDDEDYCAVHPDAVMQYRP